MSKKSDDSIERIFRQALTQYDTTFKSSDWLKMEKMLDEEANRRAAARSKRFKGTGFALIGLTGLIVAVYFLAFRNPSDSIARLNHSETEMQATDDLEDKGNVMHENPSAGLLSESDSLKATRSQNEVSNLDSLQPESHANARHAIKDNSVDNPSILNDKNIRRLKSKEENESTERSTSTASAPGKTRKQHNTKPQLTDVENKSVSPVDPKKSTANTISSNDDPITRSAEQRSQNLINRQKEKNTDSLSATFDKSSGAEKASAVENNDLSDPSLSDKEKPGTTNDPLVGSTDAIERKLNDSTGVDRQNVDAASLDSSVSNPSQRRPESIQSIAPSVSKLAGSKDSIAAEDLADRNAASDSVAQSKSDANRKQKTKPASRLSVALVIAPEFSTTSLNEYSSPGESFGLRIGYQVSNRFNVNTGLIRSNKKYIGDGDEYKPRNPAYWTIRTNGVIPEEIDSKCLVYELPVGVQFDIIQTQKSRLFASTAISSYFMISQAYDYTFDGPNPGADMGWRSSRSETYWFSIGMVSAGYERYIHRSLAIGIEPYLKISMSEIGWPNVKLFSTGAYVTLRYRFMSKKNNSIE